MLAHSEYGFVSLLGGAMAIERDRSHQERKASTNDDLVARSGLLKRALVDFALSRRFARDLNREFARTLPPGSEVDEAKSANVIDYFIMQRRLPDGRTVLEHFVAEHPNLSDAERTMLLGWHDAVEGIFEIERRDKEALVVVNLVDELTYRVRSNVGTATFSGMSPGSFLITRLVPISDEWLLSGIASILPAGNCAEIHRLAADFAQQHPAMQFRNPEKLAQGWELQHAGLGAAT